MNFKKTAIAVITVATMCVAAFSGCKKDPKATTPEKRNNNPIEQQYFGVENGTYSNDPFPASTVSEPVGSVSVDNSTGSSDSAPSGSTSLTITTKEPMKEFYLGVDGVDGYITVPAVRTRADDSYVYELKLELGNTNLPVPNNSFQLKVSGKSSSGRILGIVTQTISVEPDPNPNPQDTTKTPDPDPNPQDTTQHNEPVAPTGVTLSQNTATLTADGTPLTLIATVQPTNATNKNVNWTSSDPTVAKVEGGVVTPLAVGTATITVSTQVGNITATCEIVVVAPVNPQDTAKIPDPGPLPQDSTKTGGDSTRIAKMIGRIGYSASYQHK